jgi:hypothetical protein
MFTTNQKERFAYIGFLFQEAFKVLVSCLLSIFVPQYCEETNTTCTIYQNFQDLSPFNIWVIIFNFMTLSIFIYLYWFESQREFYFIKKLDNDPNYPDDNLESTLAHSTDDHEELKKDKTEIKDTIGQLNLKYDKIISISIAMFIMNAIFSSLLIFIWFYDGFRSVSSMITNLLLISNKLYKNWSIVSSSKKVSAVSTSLNEPISYNVLDKKIRHKAVLLTL